MSDVSAHGTAQESGGTDHSRRHRAEDKKWVEMESELLALKPSKD